MSIVFIVSRTSSLSSLVCLSPLASRRSPLARREMIEAREASEESGSHRCSERSFRKRVAAIVAAHTGTSRRAPVRLRAAPAAAGPPARPRSVRRTRSDATPARATAVKVGKLIWGLGGDEAPVCGRPRTWSRPAQQKLNAKAVERAVERAVEKAVKKAVNKVKMPAETQ